MTYSTNELARIFQYPAKIKDCNKSISLHSYDEVEKITKHPLMDYSSCAPSDDQKEINDYLLGYESRGKSILHIGIGNSSIAKMFTHAKNIDGITISENEEFYAKSLGLNNYHIIRENKYCSNLKTMLGNNKYDLIIDNNLASFVCCEKHFLQFMSTLSSSLKSNGMIITHWYGMQWILDHGVNDTEECWRLDEEKLQYIADYYELTLSKVGHVFLLTNT